MTIDLNDTETERYARIENCSTCHGSGGYYGHEDWHECKPCDGTGIRIANPLELVVVPSQVHDVTVMLVNLEASRAREAELRQERDRYREALTELEHRHEVFGAQIDADAKKLDEAGLLIETLEAGLEGAKLRAQDIAEASVARDGALRAIAEGAMKRITFYASCAYRRLVKVARVKR